MSFPFYLQLHYMPLHVHIFAYYLRLFACICFHFYQQVHRYNNEKRKPNNTNILKYQSKQHDKQSIKQINRNKNPSKHPSKKTSKKPTKKIHQKNPPKKIIKKIHQKRWIFLMDFFRSKDFLKDFLKVFFLQKNHSKDFFDGFFSFE